MVARALTTVALSFTGANDSLMAWIPVHALLGLLGGTLGFWGRGSLVRNTRRV
jgi:hypothetical protein